MISANTPASLYLLIQGINALAQSTRLVDKVPLFAGREWDAAYACQTCDESKPTSCAPQVRVGATSLEETGAAQGCRHSAGARLQ